MPYALRKAVTALMVHKTSAQVCMHNNKKKMINSQSADPEGGTSLNVNSFYGIRLMEGLGTRVRFPLRKQALRNAYAVIRVRSLTLKRL